MILGTLFFLVSLGGRAPDARGARGAQDARSAPASSLARAEEAFRALDADRDGRLGETELERLAGVDSARIALEDHDGDGTLDRDEYLVLQRHLLCKSGLRPAADLEAETARIQVLRRARGVLSARRASEPALRVGAGAALAPERHVFELPLERCSPRVRAAFEALEREVLAGRSGAREAELLRDACDAAGTLDERTRRALDALEEETSARGLRTVARLRAVRAALVAPSAESANAPGGGRTNAARQASARSERANACSEPASDLARWRALTAPGAGTPRGLEAALARVDDARTSPALELEVRVLRALLHGVAVNAPGARVTRR